MVAFEITPEDVCAVLAGRHLLLNNPNGLSHEELADDLLGQLDTACIEHAALAGGTEMDDQVQAAHDEILQQLITLGVVGT